MVIIVSDNVRACVAKGNEYPLGRSFSFLDGCIKYNCDCHSDGSWECPAARAENNCEDEPEPESPLEDNIAGKCELHLR